VHVTFSVVYISASVFAAAMKSTIFWSSDAAPRLRACIGVLSELAMESVALSCCAKPNGFVPIGLTLFSA